MTKLHLEAQIPYEVTNCITVIHKMQLIIIITMTLTDSAPVSFPSSFISSSDHTHSPSVFL